MKKIILPLLSFIATTALMLSPNQAAASGHEKTVGIGGGYATFNHSGLGKVFFQYSFSSMVRISPEISYIFRNENTTGFAVNVDCQFPFRIAKGLKFYPLAGLSYQAWSPVGQHHIFRGGLNVGGGFDLYFTQTLKLSVQGKYTAAKDCGGGFIDLGIGYVF